MATSPDAPQQYNLRWNNHTNNILQVFLEQYASERLVDVTLACQGHYLKAHKMILSACSPYFQELFNRHENPHPLIILYGMKYQDVRAIIEFMYKGEVRVLQTELDDLLELAENLQIKGLCNVRNKYEKGEIIDAVEKSVAAKKQKLSASPARWVGDEEASADEEACVMETEEAAASSNDEAHDEAAEGDLANKSVPNATDPLGLTALLSSSPRATAVYSGPRSKAAAAARSQPEPNSSNCSTHDDDLPATIKVEPPDIKDIDDDGQANNWEAQPPVPIMAVDLPGPPLEIAKPKTARPKTKNLVIQGASHTRVTELVSKIPRPPNAFMIFANEWRRKLAYEHPAESNKEISVRLGTMWKSLSPESKASYYAASRQADLDHKKKYPGYYYSPKEARIRKKLKKRTYTRSSVEAVQLVVCENLGFEIPSKEKPSLVNGQATGNRRSYYY